MGKSLYEKMGVDPHKTGVREIFGKIVQQNFPGAFCNIVRIPGRPGIVATNHSDGSGSKSVQRHLSFMEGHLNAFRGDVYDALGMNTGDVAAAGFFGPYFVAQSLAINPLTVNKEEVMRQNALDWIDLVELYKRHGIEIVFMGGETADLPNQVSTHVLDVNVYAETSESDLIKGNVQPGDVIFGFASTGQAVWETVPNSGQMSNGLTLSRLGLMSRGHYNDSDFGHLRGYGKSFAGKFTTGYMIDSLGMTIGEAILSPTRQWAIVIKLLAEELKKRGAFHLLHGIAMNTGGGATKIKNVGRGITYVKKIPLFPKKGVPSLPPFFEFILKETGESPRNMFTTFNCGIGLDVIGSGEDGVLRKAVMEVSKAAKVQAFCFGLCEPSSDGENHVVLHTAFGEFSY